MAGGASIFGSPRQILVGLLPLVLVLRALWRPIGQLDGAAIEWSAQAGCCRSRSPRWPPRSSPLAIAPGRRYAAGALRAGRRCAARAPRASRPSAPAVVGRRLLALRGGAGAARRGLAAPGRGGAGPAPAVGAQATAIVFGAWTLVFWRLLILALGVPRCCCPRRARSGRRSRELGHAGRGLHCRPCCARCWQATPSAAARASRSACSSIAARSCSAACFRCRRSPAPCRWWASRRSSSCGSASTGRQGRGGRADDVLSDARQHARRAALGRAHGARPDALVRRGLLAQPRDAAHSGRAALRVQCAEGQFDARADRRHRRRVLRLADLGARIPASRPRRLG